MTAQMTVNQLADHERLLSGWLPEHVQKFQKDFCLAPHNIGSEGLFDDDALIDLIDHYPRGGLQAFTMGDDVERFEQLAPVDTAGVRGKDVLEAIKIGRLWFKVQRIDLWGPYADLMKRVYAELTEICPGFKPLWHSAVLLLSSPNAVVYFHADAKPNMLFHIRGKKHVWLYRDGHKFLIQQSVLEDIIENFQDEEVPYSTDLERFSTCVELNAGQVLSWPQNTPHRVTAVGPFNVSISTFFITHDSDRRNCVYGANRALRRLGLRNLSVNEQGPIAGMKAFGYRAARKLKLIQVGQNRQYMAPYRINPNCPYGVQRLANPIRTEFR